MTTVKEENWQVWFDKYYAMRDDIRALVKEATEGYSPAFKAAVISAVIEDLAEQMRMYLPIQDLVRDATVDA